MKERNEGTMKTNNNLNSQKEENCKINPKDLKKEPKTRKKEETVGNKGINTSLEQAYKTKLTTLIKTLLEAYKSLPKIINIIENVIEKKASTIPMSNIYGNSYNTTLRDMNKLINMGERKDKLINLFVIIETMLKSLNDEDRKFAVLKFVQKTTTPELAKEFNVCERSVFRKSIKVIENLALICLGKNWTTAFIKNQIGNESWIYDIYNSKLEDEIAYKKK